MLTILALLLPGLAMWVVLRACGLGTRPGSAPLTVGIAVAAGIGFSAVTTFWLAMLGLTRGPVFVTLDALVWVAVGVATWWWGGQRRADDGLVSAAEPIRATAATWLARAAFAVTAAMAVATLIAHYQAAPHGEWDAWAIWNQKARFFIRAGNRWSDVLEIAWSNPSHPVLVSASVARLWAYAGEELTFAPAFLSATFGGAIVAGLIGALDARRPIAWVAGTIVVAPAAFTQLAAAQTADLPTGMFVFLSLVMLRDAFFSASQQRASLVAAGGLASLAAWTKNEGAVFLIVSLVIAAAVLGLRGQLTRLSWWGLGAAPALLTVLWFKLALTTAAPLYMQEPLTRQGVTSRVVAVERHREIGGVAARQGLQWGGPRARGSLVIVCLGALFAASAGRSRTARLALATVAPMAVGYYVVYLLTPLDATWLVSTTFERLTIQVWPVLVLAACSVGAGRESVGDLRTGAV